MFAYFDFMVGAIFIAGSVACEASIQAPQYGDQT
jgi:hypothetical protein